MSRYYVFLVFWVLHTAFLAFATDLRLVVGENTSLSVPGLIRAAVGDSRLLRVKAVNESELLLTGLRTGFTTVRAWRKGEPPIVYQVNVIAVALDPRRSEGRSRVVKIALDFLEIQAATSQKLGLRWPEGLQFHGGGSWQMGHATSGINFMAGFETARGFLQSLLQQGWAKSLARPELYVRLGEEATFHSGGEFPVSTSTENYGRYHRHVEWKTYGLTVKIKPHSVDRYQIPADVFVEISEMGQAASNEAIPSVTKRMVSTKMDFVDRETVLLSGLIRRVDRYERHSTPGLSALPIVGPIFFRAETGNKEDTELLMAMTASFEGRQPQEERREDLQKRWNETNASNP